MYKDHIGLIQGLMLQETLIINNVFQTPACSNWNLVVDTHPVILLQKSEETETKLQQPLSYDW